MIYKPANCDIYLKSYIEVFGRAKLNDITK